MIPALAAAAVAGVIIAANVIAVLPRPQPRWWRDPPLDASPPPSSVPRCIGPSRRCRRGRSCPSSTPRRARRSWPASGSATGTRTFWFDNVSPGLQLCSAVFNIYTTQRPEYGTTGPERPVTQGSGQAFCRAAPQLPAGQVVQVTGGLNAGDDSARSPP